MAMKHHGLFGLLLTLCASVMLVTPAHDADAKTEKKAKASSSEPAPLEHTPKLKPTKLAWGQKPSKVAAVYDKVIDADYLPQFKEVEPGIQEERLKEEIATKKRVFRQSHLEFDHPPGPLDGTTYEGEYGYYNDESFMKIKRLGFWRYLFFWKNKLYKVVDVYRLGEGMKWGLTFETAVEKLEKMLDTPGRKLAADENAGRMHAEVDWADAKTHFRVVNLSKKKVGFVWVDKSVEGPIVAARATAEEKKKKEMDSEVKDVLRKKEEEPPPGDKPKKKK